MIKFQYFHYGGLDVCTDLGKSLVERLETVNAITKVAIILSEKEDKLAETLLLF